MPCLWFADKAEEATKLYVGIFKNSRIMATTRYGTAGQEIDGRLPGSVMTVEFALNGHRFTHSTADRSSSAMNAMLQTKKRYRSPEECI